MTRETKIGMAVAGSFLSLVGAVVGTKMYKGDVPKAGDSVVAEQSGEKKPGEPNADNKAPGILPVASLGQTPPVPMPTNHDPLPSPPPPSVGFPSVSPPAPATVPFPNLPPAENLPKVPDPLQGIADAGNDLTKSLQNKIDEQKAALTRGVDDAQKNLTNSANDLINGANKKINQFTNEAKDKAKAAIDGLPGLPPASEFTLPPPVNVADNTIVGGQKKPAAPTELTPPPNFNGGLPTPPPAPKVDLPPAAEPPKTITGGPLPPTTTVTPPKDTLPPAPLEPLPKPTSEPGLPPVGLPPVSAPPGSVPPVGIPPVTAPPTSVPPAPPTQTPNPAPGFPIDPVKPAPIGAPPAPPIVPQPIDVAPKPAPTSTPPFPPIGAPIEPAPAVPPIGSVPPIAPPTPSAPNGFSPVPPIQSPQPTVKTDAPARYICQGNETYAAISTRQYGSPNFARALEEYNRDLPGAPDNLRAFQPRLTPGTVVLIPSQNLLHDQYGRFVSASPVQVPSTPTSRPVGTDISVGAPTPFAPKSPTSPAADAGVITYRVPTEGLYLSQIAERQLGSPLRWIDIYRLNPGLQPEQPLRPGVEIRIPAK
jgi:hypothetical protein